MKMNIKMNRQAAGFCSDGVRALVVAFLTLTAAALPAPVLAHPQASPAAARAPTTTFHFDNIPVRSALQLLAEEGDFNLVVSDSVQGNVSLHLTDVTWEQVLEIVLKLKGLEQHVEGRSRSVTTKGD